jgi:uncharacterized protein
MSRELSARQARRIALAAQGLAGQRPAGPVTPPRFRKLAQRLGVLQIDSVNVFARAHYMPVFARLGAYPQGLLEREAWGKRPSLFEYWGHVASLMPVELQPLFRWRMQQYRTPGGAKKSGLAAFAEARRDYVAGVLKEIERRGPVTGGDFAEGKREAGWWNWSDGKMAVEWLFAAGLVSVKTRRGFERVYDLTERVIPRATLAAPTPSETDAKRELVLIGARAMGVATVADLADYFRILQVEAKARADELVEAGQLERVKVEGWRAPAYLASDARLPRKVEAATLLSPFDNLIWRRERTERMFNARFRIEIYTPAAQRTHGYYVYPFLLADRIAARVDLKADRAAGVLRVQAAHLEPGADEGQTAPALAAELRIAAAWLGLADVAVAGRGDLAARLHSAIS